MLRVVDEDSRLARYHFTGLVAWLFDARSQVLVDPRHPGRSLADGTSHPFDRSGAHVADGEHAGSVCLQGESVLSPPPAALPVSTKRQPPKRRAQHMGKSPELIGRLLAQSCRTTRGRKIIPPRLSIGVVPAHLTYEPRPAAPCQLESTVRRYFLTVLLLGAMPAVLADEYTLMILESPTELAKRADTGAAGQGYWQEYASFGEALAKAGVIRGGAVLAPQDQLTLDGARLGGYFIIEAPTEAEARRWAATAPAALTGGRVVVAASAASPAMTTPSP